MRGRLPETVCSSVGRSGRNRVQRARRRSCRSLAISSCATFALLQSSRDKSITMYSNVLPWTRWAVKAAPISSDLLCNREDRDLFTGAVKQNAYPEAWCARSIRLRAQRHFHHGRGAPYEVHHSPEISVEDEGLNIEG
ncbi:hypothetical protein FOZ62_007114 [Perkinsus olseni]|uniref:Uncharacterized protein n=1 Tax=Perkinsus olseni TaxID=32597 RepID=A0A7J6QZR9_PEROL|nr:hypothetical protein FOZ62_007114 [Perkinsus olseni]